MRIEDYLNAIELNAALQKGVITPEGAIAEAQALFERLMDAYILDRGGVDNDLAMAIGLVNDAILGDKSPNWFEGMTPLRRDHELIRLGQAMKRARELLGRHARLTALDEHREATQFKPVRTGATSRSHNINMSAEMHEAFARLSPQERGDLIEQALG